MKHMHGPVIRGAAQALFDIFREGHPADKVIQRHMKANRKWGSSDRRLFAETVYDLVRWWRRLLFAMGESEADFDREGYERAVAAWCLLNDIDPAQGVALPRQVARDLKDRYQKPVSRAVRESIPDWMDAWGSRELGERWDDLLPVLNSMAPVYLRCNRLKTDPDRLLARLRSEGVACEPAGGDAVVLSRRTNVFLTACFRDGWFELQDLNSQKVALALDPQPGERVVDACAGGGGKTLHIASRMNGKGRIVALDIHARKLESLRERAARAGAGSVETRLIESNKTVKRLHGSADRLLLDVPCSGLGVVRRNPDSKYRLKAVDVERLQELQREILASYSPICRPGGRMVYSTCSIMPCENERQIETFLRSSEGRWRLLSQETLWPEADGPDGFFVATMERT